MHLFAGLNMSMLFNKLIAAGSAAGNNDSKLLPGFFSRVLMYISVWNEHHAKRFFLNKPDLEISTTRI